MVAIKNNIINKFNILDTNLNSEKTDELFAELFALMNLEHFDEENNNLTKDIKNQPFNQKIFSKLEDLKVMNFKNTELNKNVQKTDILEGSDSELELAKSLIEVFYKEIGITESSNIPKNMSKSDLKISNHLLSQINNNQKKENVNKVPTNSKVSNDGFNEVKIQNFVINIVKEPLKDKKLSKIENNFKIQNSINVENSSRVITEGSSDEIKNTPKKVITNLNQQTTLINKKNNKKNKQFSTITKSEEIPEIQSKIIKVQTNSNVTSLRNKTTKDNQLYQKKEINDKNNSKMSDQKSLNMSPNGKDFLDLLESSWGEKFSKIIKNTVNNGLNKLQIQLKPKNLGKLNLEVTLKNNTTSINIGSENQDVVSLLNENLPKLLDTIDKETKSFSSMMSGENNQNNYFNGNKNNKNFLSSDTTSNKREKSENENVKVSNHYIDVNA